MSKKDSYKYPVIQRYEIPKVEKLKNGDTVLLCPFCEPPHVILPEAVSSCGTRLEVRASQIIYKAKFDKRLVCAKCQKGGGEMVRWQEGYVHTHNCSPNTVVLNTIPKFSIFAKYVSKLKKNSLLANLIRSVFGEVMKVDEVLPNGERTGVVLGYYFDRGSHGRNQTVIPTE